MVTKSGTDDFHGSAYEYNRNTATSANDYFVKSGQIQNCLSNNIPLSDKVCNQAPKLIRNIFGGSIGRPTKKDRLFFFANYEGTRRVESSTETQAVPSPTLRDGIIQYQCLNTTDCPASTVTGNSLKTYQVPAGYVALNSNQIAGLDPLKIGPSALMLKYFNSFPTPNALGSGDGFNYDAFTWSTPISDNRNVYIAKIDYNITRDGKHRLSP